MKKLIIAVLFLGGITAQANQVTNLAHTNDRGIRYNQPESISFIERGFKFVIFTNGTFDFAPIRQVQNQGRRGYRVQSPGQAYGVTFPYNNQHFVNYNRWGEITQVGRNYISYNRNGAINQIGSVRLRYKQGRLVRVGDLRIVYNRRGHIVDLLGYVHHRQGTHTSHWNTNNYMNNGQGWYSRNSKKVKKNKKGRNKKARTNDNIYND